MRASIRGAASILTTQTPKLSLERPRANPIGGAEGKRATGPRVAVGHQADGPSRLRGETAVRREVVAPAEPDLSECEGGGTGHACDRQTTF